MSEFYKYCDLSLSPNDLPNSKGYTKSHMGTFLTLGFVIYMLYFIFMTKCNISKTYKISFYETFLDDEDKEPVITFGFKIQNDIIRYELLDSNNQNITENITKICDENLNEIKNDSIDDSHFYTCFKKKKFFVSNSTNHLIKIHFFFNNESSIEGDDNNRIKLSIKFKEPIINHELEDPFIYPEKINELNYFYDIGYITRYNKYIKIINYKTKKENENESESEIIESKFLEDLDDTSKLKENDIKNLFLGSFRLSLSKKKDIFIRTYPDILARIGGRLSTTFTITSIAYIILVRLIDNIRIFDSIKKESNKIEISELINKEDEKNNNKVFHDYENEICCCCCCCCDKQKIENNEVDYLSDTNYNIQITCEDKWHYYFYKLSRKCFKKKMIVMNHVVGLF